MESVCDDAKRLYGTSNLYEILGLTGSKAHKKKYTDEQIKKAYRTMAVKVHPDRASEEDKETWTRKFQLLGCAYKVLSDAEARKLYDETGAFGESLDIGENDWTEYFRAMFKKVTKADIEEFILKYRESNEEREDLKVLYKKYKGDMQKIMENAIGVTYEEEERLREMIDEMIAAGELHETKAFRNEPNARKEKRLKKGAKEAKEAEEALREIEQREGSSDLHALIKARQKRSGDAHDAFCDALLEKYAKPSPSKKKKTAKGKK